MVKKWDICGIEEVLPLECSRYEEAFTAAGQSMLESLEIFNDPDFETKKGWKYDCENDGIVIHVKDTAKGRFVAGRAHIGLSAKHLANQFWNHLERDAQYNDNIREAGRVRLVTDFTDLVKYTSNDIFIIKSREILAGRMLREIDGTFLLTAKSVCLPEEHPDSKTSVRAFLHLGAGRAVPHAEDPEHSCIYDYVTCMDLKGMMFKSVTNPVLGRATLRDIENVKRFAEGVLRKEHGYPDE